MCYPKGMAKQTVSGTPPHEEGRQAKSGRGILRLLVRALVLLLALALVAGLGFAGWKFRDRLAALLPTGRPAAPAAAQSALIPYCDAVSQTVYVLRLTNGFGESLPLLRESGGALAQCGEGAETGYGRIVLRGGKAYHVLPKNVRK